MDTVLLFVSSPTFIHSSLVFSLLAIGFSYGFRIGYWLRDNNI